MLPNLLPPDKRMAAKVDRQSKDRPIKLDRNKSFKRFVKMSPINVPSSPRSPGGDSLNACVLCFNDIDVYAVGECEHPLCHKCFVRLRVLCDDDQCPVCRNPLPKVRTYTCTPRGLDVGWKYHSSRNPSSLVVYPFCVFL